MMNILHLSRVVFAAAAVAAAAPTHAAVAMAVLPVTSEAPDRRLITDRDCIDCRPIRVDGDNARIYFRGERRLHAMGELLTEVSYCSPEVGAIYFPEEEEHVAAYLNKQNYHFK